VFFIGLEPYLGIFFKKKGGRNSDSVKMELRVFKTTNIQSSLKQHPKPNRVRSQSQERKRTGRRSEELQR